MTRKKARKMLPCVVVHLGEAEMKVHLCKAVQTAQSGETNEHNFLKIHVSFNNWL